MDKQQFLDLVGLSVLTSELLNKTAGKIHTHTKSQITDFPTSMPASDVKAWAKAAAKPTYTPTEVGVIGPAPTSGQVAVFDGTTGKIKSTGFTIATSVPSGAKFTDTVFVHPSYTTRSSGLYKITVDGTGHVSGVTAVTKDDITALGIPGQDTNTTYSVFKGATADASGTVGLVSAPAKGQQALYLRGDGTWATPTNTTYGLASATTNGLLSSADFAKIAKFTATEAGYLSGVTSAIQTQLNGKASSSHGTHVSYGSKTTALASGGTGAVGTSSALAREDHTHTLPAYPTALKSPNALTISLNGTSQGAYDGSAAKSFNITPASIGAATASHSHSYLPLSGGNITGPIKSSFSTSTWLSGNQGNALLSSTATAGAYVALVRYPSKNGVFCISGYEEQIHIVYTSNATISAGTNTTAKDVTLLNESGNTIFPGSVTAASFSGNASSATKATQDSAGQQINTTYIKSLSVSGRTITYTKGNGTTGTITTQDTVYSHPTSSGNKHIPSGGASGQILRWSADGTAVWGADNNTTYSVGTTTALGLTKLYTGTGTATDGTMTQAAIKTALDGKAASSHGAHVSYGTATTALTSGGTGAVGTATTLARSDHTHTLPSYPTALKSPGALTISLNGNSQGAYDGSAAKSFNITPASIGAATSSHGTHVNYGAAAPKALGTASAGSSTNVSREDHIHPLQTYVSGNAGTATKLSTKRLISLYGDATGSEYFDGSGNVYIDVSTREYCQLANVEYDKWYKFAQVNNVTNLKFGSIIFIISEPRSYTGSGILNFTFTTSGTSSRYSSIWTGRSEDIPVNSVRTQFDSTSNTISIYFKPSFTTFIEVISQSANGAKSCDYTLYSNPSAETAEPSGEISYDSVSLYSLGAAAKSKISSVTLLASSWISEGEKFKSTISVYGVTASNYIEVIPSSGITDAQYESCAAADIRKITQNTNSITLYAYGEKPEINIPMQVIIRGDL